MEIYVSMLINVQMAAHERLCVSGAIQLFSRRDSRVLGVGIASEEGKIGSNNILLANGDTTRRIVQHSLQIQSVSR